MARVHRQAVAVLGHAAQRVDVADVELGVDALAEQVHRQVTTSTLPVRSPLPNSVPSTRSAPAITPNSAAATARAAVVVRVQRQDTRVAVGDVAEEPLDGVGVDVRRVHLDRRRQVQDERAVGVGSMTSITAPQISIA